VTTQPIAIDVAHVCKDFTLHGHQAGSLKGAVLARLCSKAATSTFRALDDVTFQVHQGETLGIIGANGAGKSTLLSLITGTMVPTQGTIRTVGNLSSLLELGAGFHPDLTGRENVFLYGAIMGLSRRQMRERFDRIVAFAGLERFIDQPVKHYSSGMYVRLGFSVAVEVDPDILLIDEVLAVGDSYFQRKCLDKISEFRQRGKTLLIISHDLKTIQSVSNRILLLDGGRVHGIGEPESVVDQYEHLAQVRNTMSLRREWGTGEVRFADLALRDACGHEAHVFKSGTALQVVMHYTASGRIVHPVFGFSIADGSGRLIYGNNTQNAGYTIPEIYGEGTVTLTVEHLPMAAGQYLVSCSCHSADHRTNYHRLDHQLPFTVENNIPFEGVCYMPCQWKHSP